MPLLDARRDWLLGAVATVAQAYAAAGRPLPLFFDPPEPRCCMVHCYFGLSSVLTKDALTECHARAAVKSGVRLWNTFRGSGHEVTIEGGGSGGTAYFEWSAGPHNSQVPLKLVEAGWTAFFAEVIALKMLNM